MSIVSKQLVLLMTKLGNKKRGREEKLTLLWSTIGIECTGNIDFEFNSRLSVGLLFLASGYEQQECGCIPYYLILCNRLILLYKQNTTHKLTDAAVISSHMIANKKNHHLLFCSPKSLSQRQLNITDRNPISTLSGKGYFLDTEHNRTME